MTGENGQPFAASYHRGVSSCISDPDSVSGPRRPGHCYVTVRLKAGDLEGLGYAFTPGFGAQAIRACIEELRAVAGGADGLARRVC
jgi:hypothetical protein